MKVFVTGATGFIGGRVVRDLRARGDEVVCLVRSPEKAQDLAELGCVLFEGDLADDVAMRSGMAECDALIHGAAVYEVGIPKSQHTAMYEANVLGTERVLRSAQEEKIPRIVYISTVGAFGNTHGKVVDETYKHPGGEHTSYYEETKVQAHQIAQRLIDEEGLPCVIVQPGGVYGPGDHSALGTQMDQFLAGRMPMIAFPDLGLNMVYVDDVADGVLLALDKGQIGESYVLGGQITTMREMIETLAKVSDRKAPKRAMPTAAQGADPDRARGRQADGTASEPLGADQIGRRGHLLGQARQGNEPARVLPARTRAGSARHPRRRGQAARRRASLIWKAPKRPRRGARASAPAPRRAARRGW